MGKLNELYHHGIVGMKWGVRRYQNPDGTLTAEGKKRYSTGEVINKLTSPTIKAGKDKPNISPAEKMLKEGDKVLDEFDKGLDSLSRLAQRNQKGDDTASKLTDAELRKTIERLNLEKQYNALTAKDTSKGYETTKDVLSVVGSVVAIGAGVASIYGTIKNLK